MFLWSISCFQYCIIYEKGSYNMVTFLRNFNPPPTPATWCYWGTTQPISLMLEVRNTHCFECKFLFEKKGFNRFRAGLNKLAIICKEEIPVITFFGNKHQLYYFLRMTLPNTEHQEMERAKNCDSIHSNIMSSQLALKSTM